MSGSIYVFPPAPFPQRVLVESHFYTGGSRMRRPFAYRRPADVRKVPGLAKVQAHDGLEGPPRTRSSPKSRRSASAGSSQGRENNEAATACMAARAMMADHRAMYAATAPAWMARGAERAPVCAHCQKKCVVSVLHLPPTSMASTIKRQRRAVRNSGYARSLALFASSRRCLAVVVGRCWWVAQPAQPAWCRWPAGCHCRRQTFHFVGH